MIRKTVVELIRSFGNAVLGPTGLTIGGRNPAPGEIAPSAALTQNEASTYFLWLKTHLGFDPACIADLGASDGRWAHPVRRIFPNAKFLLVEPQEVHRCKLMELTSRDSKMKHAACVVGESNGTVDLMCHGHQSSIFGNKDGEPFGQVVRVPMKTLDTVVEEMGLPFPDLIKMDVQGAELRVLEGAAGCLKHAEFIQTEFTLLPVQKGIPLLDDLVVFLSARGFRIFDIYGICARPLDGMPVQGEALFIRKNSSFVRDFRWSETSSWS